MPLGGHFCDPGVGISATHTNWLNYLGQSECVAETPTLGQYFGIVFAERGYNTFILLRLKIENQLMYFKCRYTSNTISFTAEGRSL